QLVNPVDDTGSLRRLRGLPRRAATLGLVADGGGCLWPRHPHQGAGRTVLARALLIALPYSERSRRPPRCERLAGIFSRRCGADAALVCSPVPARAGVCASFLLGASRPAFLDAVCPRPRRLVLRPRPASRPAAGHALAGPVRPFPFFR